MTRKEILALPKEQQHAAFEANPGECVVHRDCLCPTCGHRYAFDALKRVANLVTCPKCDPDSLLHKARKA